MARKRNGALVKMMTEAPTLAVGCVPATWIAKIKKKIPGASAGNAIHASLCAFCLDSVVLWSGEADEPMQPPSNGREQRASASQGAVSQRHPVPSLLFPHPLLLSSLCLSLPARPCPQSADYVVVELPVGAA